MTHDEKKASASFRIESAYPIVGPLLPVGGLSVRSLYERAVAVVMAAKSITNPGGHEIRVVDVHTGEIVYRKTAAFQSTQFGDT